MADPSLSLTDTRARLLEHFSVYPDHDLSGWSKLWDAGNFLPFDRGCPNPALEDVLVQRGDLIGTATHHINGEKLARRKRALVPGCGRGYDVLLLASFGYDAYGLEISETAVRRAKEEQEKHSDRYPTRDETIGAGTAYFFQGDFFDPETWVSSIGRAEVSEGFDVIYDYTFLSALPPSLRPAWSKTMSLLLRPRSQGHLICVEFPTHKDPASGGPPWALPPEVYLAHLSAPGHDIGYDKNGRVERDASKSPVGGVFERVAHWQPERTHQIGMGTDWVSIWQRNSVN